MLKHSHRYEYVSASTFVFVNPSWELLGMAIADQSQLLGIEFPGYFKWMGMRGIESLLVWNGHTTDIKPKAKPYPSDMPVYEPF
jgi:hypothetical protein